MLKGIKRDAIRKDIFSFLIPWISIMCLAMALALWEFTRGGDPQITLSAPFITGLLLIGLGLIISPVAVITLRRSYSSSLVIREDHQLIRCGIPSTREPAWLCSDCLCACRAFTGSSPCSC